MRTKRRVVTVEGPKGEKNDTIIEHGALRVADIGIPVTMKNLDKLVGVASEPELDADSGALSLLFVTEDWVDLDDYTTAITISNPIHYTAEGKRIVIDGVIREIVLVPYLRAVKETDHERGTIRNG